MKVYTIEQIKNYLSKSDSLGAAVYFCDEAHLDAAQIDNKDDIFDEEEEDFPSLDDLSDSN
jgi:hypothetical protein